MRFRKPIITLFFPKKCLNRDGAELFEELLGEARLKDLPQSLLGNRQAVAFCFGGWRNIDRLIEDSDFQQLAVRLVEDNCSFGFFGQPSDVGCMALLRAWWLTKVPGAKFEDSPDYDVFVRGATIQLLRGVRKTCGAMAKDAPAFAVEGLAEGILIASFEALRGKLNPYLPATQ